MKWQNRRESSNVDDRRGFSGGKIAVGGGLIGLVFFVAQMFFGADSAQILNQIEEQVNVSSQTQQPLSEADVEMGKMVRVMLADNEDVWNKLFSDAGKVYVEPTLVLFRDATQSGCGSASASIGPFYCPADQTVYIDLSFFDELKNKYGAEGGDFAIAYVIAHEVGHHVQNLLGTSQKMHSEQQNLNKIESNKLSVALELQADFFAGIWAHYNEEMNHVLETGDIEEAISAASAVGDDHLQKLARGYVQPDGFTHGTSAQRIYWFKRGFESGDLSKGDTFKELL